ncbi:MULTISPECIES: DUF6722 family protein [Prevotella]|uniref:DUF6722 family protein n=1 Tax=Prevotella merdae TaxID=2079531 RepID=UPI001E5F9D7A|nr:MULTISPECIES: DUF6722 family protein [Prevotella]
MVWVEKLGAYFLDVSKYILTGVVIASMFKDFDNKILIYIVGLILSVLCLIVGLILTNKKENIQSKNNNKTNNKEK